MKTITSPLIAKPIAAALAVALSGCAYAPQKESLDRRSEALEQLVAETRANSATSDDARILVYEAKGSYLGAQSTALTDEDMLPAVFHEDTDYGFDGSADLKTVAARITRATGIPIRLKADITPQGQGHNGGPMPTADIPAYRGPITGLLNLVAARFNINWENQKDGVVFYRLVTKSFTLAANGSDMTYNSTLGKTGSGGSNGSGGTNGGGSSAGFTSTGSVTLTGGASVWDGVAKMIDGIKTPEGRYNIARGTGIVTITDTRDVVDLVDQILSKTNAILTRQVAVRIQMYKVNRSEDRQAGFDWSLVFNKIAALNPQWRLSAITPTSLVGSNAGGAGISILAPASSGSTLGKLNGSDLIFQAAQSFQNINLVNTVTSVSLNRRAAPAAVTSQQGYLARTTPAVSGIGGTAGLPGLEQSTVTTGFLTNVIPYIMDNNDVLLELTLDSSILSDLATVSTGSGATYQAIQTPLVDGVNMLQNVALKPGTSLVLTGYEREGGQYSQRGLTDRIETGGSYKGTRGKESIMIVVTPTIIGGVQ